MPHDLDLRLTVWYHGLKATQYFSKFTSESIAVLKKDLTILGLPQPKNQNIALLSHGAVECFWPAAAMNPVLHKNLLAKTDRTPAFHEAINQLSILSVTVKETSVPRSFPSDSAKRTSLKRPYEQRASTSTSTIRLGRSVDPYQTSRNHNASGHRPQLAHSTTAPRYSSPCDDPSRPSKIAKTHTQGFQLSAKSGNNGQTRHPFEPPASDRSQASTSTTPFTNPNSRFNHPCPPARLATNPASNMTTMDLQPLRMPSNLGFAASGAEKERVNAFLNNLELQSTPSIREPPRQSTSLPRKPQFSTSNGLALSNIRIESQRPTAGVVSDKARQVPGRNSTTVGTTVQAPTPSTSAPSPDYHSHTYSQPTTSLPTPVSPWFDSESLHHLVQKMTAGHGSTTPLNSPPPTLVEAKKTGPSAVEPAPQVAMAMKEVSRNIGEWFAEGHGIPRKNREKPDLEKVIEELNAVKKELEEERKSRREDKELLDIERQRREEAEHALADVRRECRQPFVVPSLLNAFVELSKLTTRGLKVSGSQDYPEVEDASRAVVNGHDMAASHKASSPPAGVQRTKVKLEPLDDQFRL